MWKHLVIASALMACGSKKDGDNKPAAKAAEKADSKTDAWLESVNEMQDRIHMAEIAFLNTEPATDPSCGRFNGGLEYIAKLGESSTKLQTSAPGVPATCGKAIADTLVKLQTTVAAGTSSTACEARVEWWKGAANGAWEDAVCTVAMAANPCVDAAMAAGATRKVARMRSECKAK